MLPRAPPPPQPDLFTALHAALQSGLDRVVALPRSVGVGLLALAVVITVLGRHGQRPLNAALLGCAVGAAALFGLPHLAGPGSWLPGVCAVVGAVLAGLFGIVAAGWATGALAGLLFGAAAALLSHRLKLLWPPGFVLGFGFGLLAGRVNAKGLALVLPPLFAALFAAAGAAILWTPHHTGAALWWLGDVDHALLAVAALAVALLGISLEREHQRKRRLAQRSKRAADDQLAQTLAARKDRYQRAFEEAQVEPAPAKKPGRR